MTDRSDPVGGSDPLLRSAAQPRPQPDPRPGGEQNGAGRRAVVIVVASLLVAVVGGVGVRTLVSEEPVQPVAVAGPTSSSTTSTTPPSTEVVEPLSDSVPPSVDVTTTVPVTVVAPPPTAPSVTASTTIESIASGSGSVDDGSPSETDAPRLAEEMERRVLGLSVNGVEIVARRLSAPADVRVLAIGSIHGDELAGLDVIDAITRREVPAGIELWVIDTINPDGNLNLTRGNARGVDLNRNFDSGDWAAVGADTDRYSGAGPASEPETLATQRFLDELRPSLAVWWHQVGNHVDESPNIPDPQVLQEFSDHSGLPRLVTSCGTPCVGNATTYVNVTLGGASFVVELPEHVDAEMIERQAGAFLSTAEYVAQQQ